MEKSFETTKDIHQAFETASILLSESALSRRLERWRGARLIFGTQKHPHGIRGSETHYAPGTAAKALKIAHLLADTRSLNRVGWELWWQGEEMDERHWRRRLRLVARFADRQSRKLKDLAAEHDQQNAHSTFVEVVGQKIAEGDELKRIQRRIGADDISRLVSVTLGSALGDFSSHLDADDEMAIIRGFGFAQAENDQIVGHQLKLFEGLLDFFGSISELSNALTFSEISELPKEALEIALSDVRNALEISKLLNAQLSPIFGSNAFGLRETFLAAREQSPNRRALLVLSFAALRKNSSFLYPTEVIAEMARTAKIGSENQAALARLRENPKFGELLSPKTLKRGLQTSDALSDLLRRIEAAKLSD